jgi:Heterokaryon incompatibility protein (HET)
MDHLPLPKSSPWGHIDVPLYTCEGYEYIYSSPWDTYPARQGYDFSDDFYVHHSRYYPEHHKPRLAAFAQSWLWFGLLSEFLHATCDPVDWTVDTTSPDAQVTRKITTKNLLHALDNWLDAIVKSNWDNQRASLTRIDRLLRTADKEQSALSMNIFDMFDMFGAMDLLPEPLTLSIQVLLGTLRLARNVAFPKSSTLDLTLNPQLKLLKQWMKKDGWCPSEMTRLRQDNQVMSEYCASMLGPVQAAFDHAKCDDLNCVATQIDQSKYCTRHVSDSCICQMSTDVGPEIARILRDGAIPVIRLNIPGNQVEVMTAELRPEQCYDFVAISHVWADGLGNPFQNSLPLCQLRKIQEAVNRAEYEGHETLNHNSSFWIDTICVPVEDRFGAERSLAILKMLDIYKRANLVLILNKELEEIDSNRSKWELCARITRTAWFRRLWTLHEGVLARKCMFQLADCAVEMSEIKSVDPGAKHGMREIVDELIVQETSRPYTKMQRFKALARTERIQEIWSTVQWRVSSNRDDETICLANMLDIPLTSILVIDRHQPNACVERMKAFILQQGLFPTESIFEAWTGSGDEPRLLSDVGFRWAPSSFVFRHSSGNHLPFSPLALADAEGLHVSLPGIRLGGNWKEFLQLVRIDRRSTSFLEEYPELKPMEPMELAEVRFMLPFQWDVFYVLRWFPHQWNVPEEMLETTEPALVLQNDLVEEDIDQRSVEVDGRKIREFLEDAQKLHPNVSDVFVGGSTCTAIVVALLKASTGVIDPANMELKGGILGYVDVHKMMFDCSGRSVLNQMDWMPQEKNRDFGYFESLPPTTAWCIG